LAALYLLEENAMLSDRLKAIASMVPKSATVADIGCDHGKIAVELISNGTAQKVICADISGASLDKARKLANAKGFEARVSLRQGDGLSVLEAREADIAVIAGMGGELIADILQSGMEKAPDTLVLSSNTASGLLRKWLYDNGYIIVDEELVFETRHFYPVMLAMKGNAEPLSLIEQEFGPVLLKKRHKVLKQLVRKRIEVTKDIRKKLIKANQENKEALRKEIDEKLKMYEEVEKWL
jgi:tRNA (adenine22-N1)-methyltransferase